jgi:ligand-binding sensor domain-containing protein/signal transduction histidine kinase
VQCLAQTGDGYLWVGTRSGPARFDGLEFTCFDQANTSLLKHDACKGLAEDKDGNLWIATKHGVLGYRHGAFQLYTGEHGLAGDETTSVCASREGGVWVGTEGGLSRIRAGQVTNYRHPGWERQFIYSVWEDPQGRVWAGSTYGLFRLDLQSGVFTEVWKTPEPLPTVHHNVVRCLREDARGNLWFGTGHGLYRWREDTIGHFASEEGLSGPEVTSLCEDGAGTVWVVAGNRLQWFGADERFHALDEAALEGAEVKCVFEDREANLWVGTRASGLFRLRPRRAITFTTQDGLADDLVWSVCEGRDGQLWVATETGVSEFRDGRFSTLQVQAKVPRLAFRSALEDHLSRLWLGTSENGLYCLIRDGSRSHTYIPPAGRQIRSLCQRRNAEVWVGTKEGLARLIPRDPPSRDVHDAPAKLQLAETWLFGPSYVSRLRGGWHWRYENGTLTHHRRGGDAKAVGAELQNFMGEDWTKLLPRGELAHYDVQAILEDREGNLWLGTAGGGLNRWRDNEFTAFTKRDGLVSDHVTTMLEDSTGTVWIGTTEGLSRLQAGRFAAITTRHGLFSDLINQMVADDLRHLWIGCNRGIYRVSLRDLNAVADGTATDVNCLVLGEADGMLSSETTGGSQPAACKTRDGKLWFSTIKGLVMIDPTQVHRDEVPPPVVIEQLRANDVTVFRDGVPMTAVADRFNDSTLQRFNPALPHSALRIPRSALRLAPGAARVLELRYTANYLSAPEKVRFKYRLEGYDDHWVDAGPRRVAYYTNLRPGGYRFRVQACNLHGVWNEQGASLAFTLAPFFWQTWWFRTGSVLSFAGLTILVAWQVIRVRERIHRLEHEKALARERERIARDMHDDIGSRLNQLALLAELAEPPASGVPTAKPSPGALARLAHEAASSLDEIVWAVQPGKDDLQHLAQYLGQYADEYLAPTGLQLEIDYPPDLPAWPLAAAQRHNLFLAAKEALHNVVKHAAATKVALRLRITEEAFTLEIADNGRGFAADHGQPASVPPHNREAHGLANLRRRAEAAGGDLVLQSEPHHGTQITITVPSQKGRRPMPGE